MVSYEQLFAYYCISPTIQKDLLNVYIFHFI